MASYMKQGNAEERLAAIVCCDRGRTWAAGIGRQTHYIRLACWYRKLGLTRCEVSAREDARRAGRVGV